MAALKPIAKVLVEKFLLSVGEEGTTVLEICQATDVSESMVRKSVQDLEKEGRARRKSGFNQVPDTWWAKLKSLTVPEYTMVPAEDGHAWDVLRRPAGLSDDFEKVLTYELEAAAVEVAHVLNGWAGRER